MPRRHPVPAVWLMTDDRLGDGLLRAVRRLPPGAGVVIRERGSAGAAVLRRIRMVATARRLVVVTAGRRAGGAGGVHNGPGGGLRTRSVHDAAQMRAARRGGAAAVFVSPVWPTRSHPGAATLGVGGFARLAARAGPVAAIALGGMDAARFRRLRRHGAHGWAAIDAWSR